MSTNIEFKRMAFVKGPEGLAMNEDDIKYVVFVKYGSNNVLTINGKIAKSWGMYQHGTRKDILEGLEVAETSVEGGGLRSRSGSFASFDSYTKIYKKLMNDAKPFKSIGDYFRKFERYIKLDSNGEHYDDNIQLLRKHLDDNWEESVRVKHSYSGEKEKTTFKKNIEEYHEIEEHFDMDLKKIGIKGDWTDYSKNFNVER